MRSQAQSEALAYLICIALMDILINVEASAKSDGPSIQGHIKLGYVRLIATQSYILMEIQHSAIACITHWGLDSFLHKKPLKRTNQGTHPDFITPFTSAWDVIMSVNTFVDSKTVVHYHDFHRITVTCTLLYLLKSSFAATGFYCVRELYNVTISLAIISNRSIYF